MNEKHIDKPPYLAIIRFGPEHTSEIRVFGWRSSAGAVEFDLDRRVKTTVKGQPVYESTRTILFPLAKIEHVEVKLAEEKPL